MKTALPAFAKLVGEQSFETSQKRRIKRAIWILDGKVYSSPWDNRSQAVLIHTDWINYCADARSTPYVVNGLKLYHLG